MNSVKNQDQQIGKSYDKHCSTDKIQHFETRDLRQLIKKKPSKQIIVFPSDRYKSRLI